MKNWFYWSTARTLFALVDILDWFLIHKVGITLAVLVVLGLPWFMRLYWVYIDWVMP
jgi:hypothetical protein